MADHLAVLDPGMQSTLQDLGRYGLQRFGISAAGAIDPMSMQIANALVGNARDEAALELTLSGGTYRVEAEHCRLALAGADMPVAIDGVPAAPYRAHDLKRGSVVSIGFARTGMRAYLAVAGGFAVEPVLGSRSTHLRSQLGGFNGCALKVGDLLALRGGAADSGRPLMLPEQDRPAFEGSIRVVLGPQEDAFTQAGIEMFLSSAYTVTSKTDRMGCQLDGPPIEHRDGFNNISDGIVNGSIQVPGSGPIGNPPAGIRRSRPSSAPTWPGSDRRALEKPFGSRPCRRMRRSAPRSPGTSVSSGRSPTSSLWGSPTCRARP